MAQINSAATFVLFWLRSTNITHKWIICKPKTILLHYFFFFLSLVLTRKYPCLNAISNLIRWICYQRPHINCLSMNDYNHTVENNGNDTFFFFRYFQLHKRCWRSGRLSGLCFRMLIVIFNNYIAFYATKIIASHNNKQQRQHATERERARKNEPIMLFWLLLLLFGFSISHIHTLSFSWHYTVGLMLGDKSC